MLKVVADGPGGVSRSALDEIVLDGARRMLAAALEAEVAAYVDALAGEVDGAGRRLVVRNGHLERRSIKTAAGAVEIEAPRVDDRRVDPETGERADSGARSCRRGAGVRRRSLSSCRCCTSTA